MPRKGGRVNPRGGKAEQAEKGRGISRLAPRAERHRDPAGQMKCHWAAAARRAKGGRSPTEVGGPQTPLSLPGPVPPQDGPGRLLSGRPRLPERLGRGHVAERLPRTRVRPVPDRLASASVICWKSVSLEKYPRTRPFACSFRPRSQEWYGVAKKNPAPSAFATRACPANSLPLSAVIVWTRAASGSSISSSAAPTAAAVLRPTL